MLIFFFKISSNFFAISAFSLSEIAWDNLSVAKTSPLSFNNKSKKLFTIFSKKKNLLFLFSTFKNLENKSEKEKCLAKASMTLLITEYLCVGFLMNFFKFHFHFV